MLEIVRGRTWQQQHTFVDSKDEDPSDLSEFVTIRSQIREKVAVRDKKTGVFTHPLVVTVDISRYQNVVTSSLSREETAALEPRDYLIDMLGTTEDGVDVALMDPEPILVVNRPTYPSA